MAERKGFFYTELTPEVVLNSRLKPGQHKHEYHGRRGGNLTYVKDNGVDPRVMQHRLTGRMYVVADSDMALSEMVADGTRATTAIQVLEGKALNGAEVVFGSVTRRLEVKNAKARTTQSTGSEAVVINNNGEVIIGGDVERGSVYLGGNRTRTRVKGVVSYLRTLNHGVFNPSGDHRVRAREVVVRYAPEAVRVRERGSKKAAARRD